MLKATLTCLLATSVFTSSAWAQTFFVNDAKVVTNTADGILESTDVLIEDGQVTAIGDGLTAPSGAEVIEANGAWLTPGLFAPMSQIGLVEIGAESATNDTRAAKADTSVSDRGADSFNPNSPVIDITRVAGITHAAIAPSASHNIFGGLGLVANTSGEFDSVQTEIAFVFVQLGERGAGLAGGSRSASMGQLRAALDDAMAYPGRFKGPSEGDTLSRRDAAALAPAARGRLPIVIAADRASDLLNIIDLKNDYGRLDIIIYGGAEGWMVAEQLADNYIRVMVDPQENLPDSFDRVGARLDNAYLLHKAGVEIAISTRSAGTSHNIRVLTQHAGNAVATGLDWGEAFKAISRTPAYWFNIKTGTIETAKPATLVLWDGDPLEVTSEPTFMLINGQKQSLESRQTKLRDRYNPTSGETKPHKYR